ncbi:MAG: MOSC domain-containing protein [Chromatocurvus sp.]
MMKLISVNIGRPFPVFHESRFINTGIFKASISGPVMLRRLNLDGDGQADLRVHGGADKAVYVYPFEHYAFWAGELSRDDFDHGQFGENFTVIGLLEDAVFIGDEFQIGEARVQVTQPRSPCFKLGIRMNDDQFPALFSAVNRTGFYLRVLQEGRVSAGDVIRHSVHTDSLSVRDVFRMRYTSGTREEYERAVCLPSLSASWRAVFEKRLAEGPLV